ncbi:hypothetical protein [Pseudalkalibacillus sp. SCS-8]|uniref:hypothetical protein n=1 Tax=Pseudalkalibacillus nanhaiensis TaxID=3115291 RepID=UPI0032D9B172
MVKQKNPFIAFLLSVIPGVGLMYLGKSGRGILFLLGMLGLLPMAIILREGFLFGEVVFITLIAGFLLYTVSIIHTILTASKIVKDTTDIQDKQLSSERFYTIILSMVPGLGHFQLGLMNRGITFLASFLGLMAMILFVTIITGMEGFLIFLIIIPVIWVYNFFDTMQLLNKKEAGEDIRDRSILEDFEAHHQGGRKSTVLATLLSMFPGAGHLYLGYQRRGIQLMAAFLFSIYILDVLHLGLFLFLVPIIWFFSFFDGMQRATNYKEEPLDDEPVLTYIVNYKKWIGVVLIIIGIYYPLANIVMPELSFNPIVKYYVQTGIVCLIMIIGGFKLIAENKKKNTREEVKS